MDMGKTARKERGIMTIHLVIPDSIAQAMRLPTTKRQEQLMVELALTLYAQRILSFGKACELAGVERLTFSRLLGERDIPRHYSEDDLQDDLKYAGSK
jgi:predicted HTH domain antitoxin